MLCYGHGGHKGLVDYGSIYLICKLLGMTGTLSVDEADGKRWNNQAHSSYLWSARNEGIHHYRRPYKSDCSSFHFPFHGSYIAPA